MQQQRNIPQLAVIIPCYNEELCIKDTTEHLIAVLNDLIKKSKIKDNSYLYFIDDGSKDRTWSLIEELHKQIPIVKGAKLIKNYGNQKALLAGLESVREFGCDCVISIDADLQQDETAIGKFIDEYINGADIVLGIRNEYKKNGFFRKTTSLIFNKIMTLCGENIPMNHSDYRLVSKKALDILKSYPEKKLFLRGFFTELGLPTKEVIFDIKNRTTGKSKFTLTSLIILALNGITAYSVLPLRLIPVLGFFMALFGFIVGIETVWEKIYLNNTPNGLATAITLICIFGGIQLLCIGVLGEYIGQIYNEVQARPRYIKDKELY